MAGEEYKWARWEPMEDIDGSIWAQRLVIEFDNDVHQWSMEQGPAGSVIFKLELPEDQVESFKKKVC